MMKRTIIFVVMLLLMALMVMPANAKANLIPRSHSEGEIEAKPSAIQGLYDNLPLYFEPNQGQTNERISFLYHGHGYNLYLVPTEIVIVLTPGEHRRQPNLSNSKKAENIQKDIVSVSFIGADPTARIKGVGKLRSQSHYLIGKNPEKWRRNLPHYEKVLYEGLYSGIDVAYYGNQRQLEYDFIVAPGASPEAIAMEIKGARRVSIDDSGSLVLATDAGDLVMRAPTIYQEKGIERKKVEGGYLLRGKNIIGFQVAEYDKNKPLTIDPVLRFSTYFGGTSWTTGIEYGNDIAVDADGNIYITGTTAAADLPITLGAFDPVCGEDTWADCECWASDCWPPPIGGITYVPSTGNFLDAFIAKIDPSVPELVYVTYLGEREEDRGNGIAVDGAGNVYVTGSTRSLYFPTLNGFDGYPSGNCATALDEDTTCRACFLTKLNADGSTILYSTLYDSNLDGRNDEGADIAVDPAGNAYVTGTKRSWYGFVLKVDTTLSGFASRIYQRELPYLQKSYAIAVDSAGQAHVAGSGPGTGYPDDSLAFVRKLNSAGNGYVYELSLNGRLEESAAGIALSPDEEAFVTGWTNSDDFPTVNAFQPNLGTPSGWAYKYKDAFVAKIDKNGNLVFSSYLGGAYDDWGTDIFVTGVKFWNGQFFNFSGHDNAFIIGTTKSVDFPTEEPIQDQCAGGSGGSSLLCNHADAFVARVDRYYKRDFQSGIWVLLQELGRSSFLGGTGEDEGKGIRVDSNENIYLVGTTASSDFPTSNPIQSNKLGSTDAFVVKINESCPGDFDNDQDVDGSDLAVFAADFGRTDCSGDCEGDFDGDNDVDGSDLAAFAADFGRTDCR